MFGYLAWGSTLTLTDLYVKSGIENTDDSELPYEVPGTKGKIVLRKSHNPGLVMGLIKQFPAAVKVIPAAALAVFSVFWLGLMSIRGHIAEKIAATFILAGGAGNLVDRLMRGYVVDWFSVKIGALKNIVFNLSDMFVFIGGAIFALLTAAGAVAGALRRIH